EVDSSRATRTRRSGGLPGGLGDAGQLAPVRHLPNADAAQAELAVHRLGPSAPLAPGVRPDRELRLPRGLEDQRLLRHRSRLLAAMRVQLASSRLRIPRQLVISLKGNPRCLSSARPSSSVRAVVTIVMSMP